MSAFVEEKQKRITNKPVVETEEVNRHYHFLLIDDLLRKYIYFGFFFQHSDDEPKRKKRKDYELSYLVKSVKSKTQTMLPNKTNKSK